MSPYTNESFSKRNKAINPALSQSFLVGSTAQVCETFILGHILDRIKIQQEANPSLHVSHAIDSIFQKGGWKEMYKGFKWNLISNGLKGAFGWSLHNFCNQKISHLYPQNDPAFPSLKFTFTVACATGVAEVTLFLCPLERFKIFQMTQTNGKTKTLWQEIRHGGVKFAYRGWSWMVLQKSWSWTGYLTVYQTLRYAIFNYNESKPLSIYQKILLGVFTGGLAAFLNSPFDLLKTQIQKADILYDTKILNIALSIFKNHGWRGMFRGLTMKLTRTAWSTAFTILLLDHFNALPHNMKI